ncbi:MAG TPA: ATP-binding protein [Dehalococcoidia bacterium]
MPRRRAEQTIDPPRTVPGIEGLSPPRTNTEVEPPSELHETLTQLRRAEAELRRQNEELLAARSAIDAQRQRYKELFEAAPDAYLVTDLEGAVLEANHAAGELLGIAIPFLVRKPLIVFFRLEDRQEFRHVLTRIMHEGSVKDWRLQLRDRSGYPRYVSATVALAHPEGPGTMTLRWLLRDISEQVSTEEEILQLNETLEERVRERTVELEQANAAKDDFLGMVSHELNTPITTIMGNAEVLSRRIEQIDAKSRAAALADIRGEAERLHHIIDNMLVLARLSRGQEIGLEPLMVQHLVREVIDRHQREHPNRLIDADIQHDLPPVLSAPVYTRQVLSNLLSNAEKYSPPSLPIEVEACVIGEEVEVAVRDHGNGLTEDEIAEIFTPFYRSPRTASHAPGIGIGLSVCKRLIEAQGGRIRVQGRPGGGLEVAFALPLDHEFDDVHS